MRKVVFRRCLSFVFLSALLVCTAFITGCTDDDRSVLQNTTIYVGDLTIEIGQWSREGNVVGYKWDGTEEGLTVNIPDVTDHDEKITSLGSYYPSMFGFCQKPLDDGFEEWTGPYGKPLEEGTQTWKDAEAARQEYMKKSPLYGRLVEYEGEDESLYDAPISFEKLTFTINLNRYISSIKMNDQWADRKEYIGIRQDDNSIVFYKPVVYFNCDPQNENFYAENGYLYSIKTKELVETGIEYYE